MTDTEVLALTIWGEARGEPLESKVGVANVIKNRATAKNATVSSICLAPHQFSCWTEEKDQMGYAEEAIHGLIVMLPDLVECVFLAEGIMTNKLRDNTHGANHYYATSIAAPRWAIGATPLAHLGHHIFFNVK